jgi:uncharacterized protein YaiL (DUF2058 family)
MLDLKSKLLAAGVVTEKQVKKVEEAEARKRERKKRHQNSKQKDSRPQRGSPSKKAGGFDEKELWQRRIRKLQKAPKSEQYSTIRGWVERARLDSAKAVGSEEAERFHFTKADERITWITLEPDTREALKKGEAGIIAFMSHNGLSHCVVPRDLALDIHQIRPEWLRKLENYAFEPLMVKPEPKESKKTIDPSDVPATDGETESNLSSEFQEGETQAKPAD